LPRAAEMARPEAAPTDPLWYKDAIIYQLHIKAFFDANNDGVGDLEGLTRKLDYLLDLGVTALWLLPFYPSPLRDDGYDIADYRNIHPAYGRMSDFRAFVREAHRRGLRIITELVINHTSHQPDLNFDNPHVFRAITNVMRYWLDLGVDGMRLDAVPYLIEREGTINENLPETHEILKRLRREMDRRYGDRMLLAEANQWPE